MSRRTEVHEVSRSRIVVGLRALHAPFDVYETCGHNHALNDPAAFEIRGLGMVCADGIVDTVCTHCCADESGQTDRCAAEHKHLPDYALCPTMAIVEGRDGPWVP